jgi:hypothetical protein
MSSANNINKNSNNNNEADGVDDTASPTSSKMLKSDDDRRQLSRSTKPIPCYRVEQLPTTNKVLYEKLRTAVEEGNATLVEKLKIPPRDARSWRVPGT